MNRNVSEDELRRQVIKEMKGDVNQKMDSMIKNLKKYRSEFVCNRVPTFLMNKQQLDDHKN